ncbi:MAG: SDR family oxidoreductase [Anaerolineae bacterium]|nr:MAG: SDR family oxidoreductase [Anaerolineae bacterium]
MESTKLAGRVAIVTGVSRRIGIGHAIAKRLLEMGADVFVQSLTRYDAQMAWGADNIENVLTELRTIGPRVEHLEADFLDPHAAEQVVSAAVQAFGHVDMLVANHAYSLRGALEDLTAEHIDAHLQANVRGTLLLVKAFAAQFQKNSGGRVIMMTSGQHLGPMSSELAYIASKGAIHQLTLSLSDYLVRRGITVNTVNPGATDTGYADAALYELVKEHSPQGRWGEPDDAARLIAWLCTDDARWITGQVINSTGGGW